MKIALVHDYLVQHGGAERVLAALAEVFPEAPIYTLVHDEKAMRGSFAGRRIYTSWLQKFPLAATKHRIFPLLMPLAAEQFDFSQFDVVFSDSASFAKGIITRPETLHICYLHTPMRYAWDDCQRYTQDFYFPQFIKRLVPFFMNYLRLWDSAAAQRPDLLLANSNFVASRIRKYYRREAKVIHPPVEVEKFQIASRTRGYFLMVGRLIAYKRHDIAIQAFNQLGLPLKIIGRGPELKRLQKMAGPNIEFLGRVSDQELPNYYVQCEAFIFPQEEDFGIVAIEALAAGRPLIAFRGGDIPEHAPEDRVAVYFEKQTTADLVTAVQKFLTLRFDSDYIRTQALKFDKQIFQQKIRDFVVEKLAQHQKQKTRKSEHQII